MTSANPPACPNGITPDSDIAGIGTRITIYAQAGFASLPLFTIIVMLILKLPRQAILDMYNRSRNSAWSFYLTGVAMLVTSYIKLSNRALSPYHAAIVLNLNWIIVLILLNSFSTMIILLAQILFRPRRDTLPKMTLPTARTGALLRYMTIVSIYLVFIGVLGIKLFRNIYTFSATPDCVDETVYWVFGSHTPITAHWISRAFRGAYIILLIPLINFFVVTSFYACLVVLIWFAGGVGVVVFSFGVVMPITIIAAICRIPGLQSALRKLFGQPRTYDTLFGVVIYNIASVFLLAFLIASNEKMIGANPVASGEMSWGFGQILSVLLLVSPAYDAIQDIWNCYTIWRVHRRNKIQLAENKIQPAENTMQSAKKALDAAPAVRSRAMTA